MTYIDDPSARCAQCPAVSLDPEGTLWQYEDGAYHCQECNETADRIAADYLPTVYPMGQAGIPLSTLRWHRTHNEDGTLVHYADSPRGRYLILADGVPSCRYSVVYVDGTEAVSPLLSEAKAWCESDARDW